MRGRWKAGGWRPEAGRALAFFLAATLLLFRKSEAQIEWTGYVSSFGVSEDGMVLMPAAGACGYAPTDLSLWPYGFAAAVAPSSQLSAAHQQQGCNACLSVSCASPTVVGGDGVGEAAEASIPCPEDGSSGSSVVVTVVDLCFDCQPDELRLPAHLLSQLSGRTAAANATVSAAIRQVPCTPGGGVRMVVQRYDDPPNGTLQLVFTHLAGAAQLRSVALRPHSSTNATGSAPGEPPEWVLLQQVSAAEWRLRPRPQRPPYDIEIQSSSGEALVMEAMLGWPGLTGAFFTRVQFNAALHPGEDEGGDPEAALLERLGFNPALERRPSAEPPPARAPAAEDGRPAAPSTGRVEALDGGSVEVRAAEGPSPAAPRPLDVLPAEDPARSAAPQAAAHPALPQPRPLSRQPGSPIAPSGSALEATVVNAAAPACSASVLDILSRTQEASFFRQMVLVAGLGGIFGSLQLEATVMVPVDFGVRQTLAVLGTSLGELLQHPHLCREIVLYHLLPGTWSTERLLRTFSGTAQLASALQPAWMTLELEAGGPAGGALEFQVQSPLQRGDVLWWDWRACAAVLHFPDRLMLPHGDASLSQLASFPPLQPPPPPLQPPSSSPATDFVAAAASAAAAGAESGTSAGDGGGSGGGDPLPSPGRARRVGGVEAGSWNRLEAASAHAAEQPGGRAPPAAEKDEDRGMQESLRPGPASERARCVSLQERLMQDRSLSMWMRLHFLLDGGNDAPARSTAATLFVPSNGAVQLLREEAGVDLMELVAGGSCLEAARALLAYHSLPGWMPLAELSAKSDGFVNTQLQLPGSRQTLPLIVTARPAPTGHGMLLVESAGSSARLLHPDIHTCTAVVHVIDRVLLPSRLPFRHPAAGPRQDSSCTTLWPWTAPLHRPPQARPPASAPAAALHGGPAAAAACTPLAEAVGKLPEASTFAILLQAYMWDGGMQRPHEDSAGEKLLALLPRNDAVEAALASDSLSVPELISDPSALRFVVQRHLLQLPPAQQQLLDCGLKPGHAESFLLPSGELVRLTVGERSSLSNSSAASMSPDVCAALARYRRSTSSVPRQNLLAAATAASPPPPRVGTRTASRHPQEAASGAASALACNASVFLLDRVLYWPRAGFRR